jgi:bifunctional non-homologous end joining protein LigD
VCLDHRGKPHFRNLLFRRREPHFFAFDGLAAHGDDLRVLPLIERKRRLFGLLRNSDAHVRFVDFVHERGRDLFAEKRRRDLEGIVAEWANGTYQTGPNTSWLKIKNPTYSRDTSCSRRADRWSRDRYRRRSCWREPQDVRRF